MPRAKPKVDRVCLVCASQFEGTPAATRCDPCKAAGHSVPRAAQKAQRKKPAPRRDRPQQERTCMACGTDFTTPKAKAVRCDPCISADNSAPIRKCNECNTTFHTLTAPDAIRCEPCADALGLDRFELSPEDLERLREEERYHKFIQRRDRHRAWLDHREKPAKSSKKMTKHTAKTPIGILWLQLCHADGAASSIMYAGDTADLTDDQKLNLMTSFYRLRSKGLHPATIAKLCPLALLEDATQVAIADLPHVAEPQDHDDDDDDDEGFDPFEGDTALAAEMAAFAEQNARRIDAIRLGLAD